MNLKLLEKLVRLANNNPNENESNLAARKVCRIIEEGKFKFIPDSVDYSKPPYTGKVEVRPQGTWNDVRRSTEPEFKSARGPFSRATEPFDFSNFDINDFFNRHKQSQQPKDPRWREKTASEQARDSKWNIPKREKPFDPNRDYYAEFMAGDKGEKTKKQEREKKPLNCKRCGEQFLTGFVGPPQMFTCNTCYWVIYHEEQEAKKGNNQ